MSRQDKATTERNARTLREFIKKPENKLCADCKRNDPRWASWNLGVYLCIRCSGIHRGMGTHISKIKSIDLDTWTPDQMQSIGKWGNRRANLYWEAHLKAGHIPPEHKMESFIRSKYETRRWAPDGPPPSDPSSLENESGIPVASTPASSELLTGTQPPPLPPPQTQTQLRTNTHTPVIRPPHHHQLLSTAVAGRAPPTLAPPVPGPGQPQAPAQAPAQQKAPEPENDLFSLDFHAPTNNGTMQQQPQPKKDVKNDILSLFSTPAQTNTAAANNSAFGQFQSSPPNSAGASSSAAWGSFGVSAQPTHVKQQPQTTSMMGTNGVGAWGASSGWTAPAAAPPAQGNLWGAPMPAPAQQQQPDLFGGNVWGSSGAGGLGSGSGLGNGGMDLWGSSGGGVGTVQGAQRTQKKDDAFGDIWGGFK